MTSLALCYGATEEQRLLVEQHVGRALHAWPAPRSPDYASVLVGFGQHAGTLAAAWTSFSEQARAAVRVVVLVGPTAPWAEQRCSCRQFFDGCAGLCGDDAHLPLGPLEPLRAVAEMARCTWTCGDWVGDDGKPEAPTVHTCTALATRLSAVYERATVAVCDVNHEKLTPWGGWDSDDVEPLRGPRLIITAHPEREACAGCGGKGERAFAPGHWIAVCDNCVDHKTGHGTGRALGSAEVARELSGDASAREDIWQRTDGGLTTTHYPSRVAHDEHALQAALGLVVSA